MDLGDPPEQAPIAAHFQKALDLGVRELLRVKALGLEPATQVTHQPQVVGDPGGGVAAALKLCGKALSERHEQTPGSRLRGIDGGHLLLLSVDERRASGVGALVGLHDAGRCGPKVGLGSRSPLPVLKQTPSASQGMPIRDSNCPEYSQFHARYAILRRDITFLRR